MKLNGLLDLGQGLPAIDELAEALATQQSPESPLDVYGAARPYIVASLARVLNRPLVVVTARSVRARQWVDELRIWLPDEVPVYNFADPDALPYERIPWAPETRQRRLEALVGLLSWSGPTPATPLAPVAVASARGLMQMTLPVREMRLALRPVRQGQAFDLDRMLLSWVGLGYESAAVVEAPGQFSRRGGIVDIWPPNVRRPVRIELFGDEIDSLRTFDPSTQRTMERIQETLVGPASEALPRLGERAGERLARLDLACCHPPARVEFEREIEALRNGSGFRNLEWYLPYLYSQPGTLADYLPARKRLADRRGCRRAAGQPGGPGGAGGAIGPRPEGGRAISRPWWPRRTSPGPALAERLTARPVVYFGHTTLGRGGVATRRRWRGSPCHFQRRPALWRTGARHPDRGRDAAAPRGSRRHGQPAGAAPGRTAPRERPCARACRQHPAASRRRG